MPQGPRAQETPGPPPHQTVRQRSVRRCAEGDDAHRARGRQLCDPGRRRRDPAAAARGRVHHDHEAARPRGGLQGGDEAIGGDR